MGVRCKVLQLFFSPLWILIKLLIMYVDAVKGPLGCVVRFWISWLQACGYSVWRGHVLLLYPQAVSGKKEQHMWHPLLVWSSPVHPSEMCICRGKLWSRYFVVLSSDCDGYFSAISCPCLVSLPWCYQHLSWYTSFIRLFPAPSVFLSLTCCRAPLSPPEPRCNIHDGVESSQRHAGDTQKDLEKLLLPL